jgi:hypothetical protein
VGFYGGVNYGGGYTGEGYAGGRWEHNRFRYNTAVNNINTTVIHNTYNQTVINNITVNKVSYNGGAGGIARAPSNRDQEAAHERHIPPPALQMRHITEAGRNPELQAKFNQGRPPIAATPRATDFTAPNIVRARGANTPVATAPGGSRPAEAGYRPADGRPGNYRDATPSRGAAPAQSPQAAATRAPTDTPQQPPHLRPEFAQPQQRPQPQAQYAQPQPQNAQPQQRPQPQAQYAQPQQRPQPQAQYSQPQQRPQPQAQYAQPQQRAQPQPQPAQPQQRAQPQPQPAQPQQRAQPQAPHPAPPAAHPQTPRDDGKREGNNRDNRAP